MEVKRGRGRPKSRWIDEAEIGGRMPRMQVARDICLMKSRSTQDCRADDNDDDDDDFAS
jgi:hypothetical protein